MRLRRKEAVEMDSTKPHRKTPNIHEAAFYGDCRELQDSLNNGQKPNERDSAGRTAFHIASANGHTHFLKVFVGFGYDVNDEDGIGLTATHHAARNGHLETLKWLVANGANHRRTTEKGSSALDVAVANTDRQGQRDVITYLKHCDQEKRFWEK